MKFAVVGDPVAHSRSPAIHEAGYRQLGLEATYVHWHVRPDEFGDVVSALRTRSIDGVNVTMPHKSRAFAAVDRRSPDAERTGAVNTIVVHGGELVGYNTDVAGVRHALAKVGTRPTDTVMVLGAGGAAAAALVAAEDNRLLLSARRSESGRELLARVGVDGEVRPWGNAEQAAVVINATPLGMRGESLPPGVVERSGAFIDMVYGDQATPAVRDAVNIGIPFADGIDMLVGQAVEAFELFTGSPISPFVLEMAARTAET